MLDRKNHAIPISMRTSAIDISHASVPEKQDANTTENMTSHVRTPLVRLPSKFLRRNDGEENIYISPKISMPCMLITPAPALMWIIFNSRLPVRSTKL